MPPSTVSPMTIKRIHREVADLKKEDLGAMTLAPSDDNLFLWKGQIPGPEGSVYEGGLFNVEVTLAQDYPFTAPKVTFKTRIYHMNISDRGDICIDILKHNWSPALSLFKVMLSLSSLLTDPNPRDPLVGAIANQYTTNRKHHDSTARQWTDLYARPKPPQPPPAKAEPSDRARGKAKAETTSPATSSGSRAGAAPIVNEDPITIEDSDDEETKPAVTGSKRKRGSHGRTEGVGEGTESDDEVEMTIHEGRSHKRPATGRARTPADNAGRRGPSRQVSSEVIVIEDD